MIRNKSSTNENRAQLFMLTAIIIAITFLVLAFALNVAIFNENAASRTTDVGDKDTLEITKITDNVGEKIVLSVQAEGNQTYSEMNDSFNKSLWKFSRAIETEYSRSGATTTVYYKQMIRGTQVEQTKQSDFTWSENDSNGNCWVSWFSCDSGNWTLTNNSSNIRSMNMTVNQTETKMIITDNCTLDVGCITDDLMDELFDLEEPIYSIDLSKNGNPHVRMFIFEECRKYDSSLLGGSCEEYGLRIITVDMKTDKVMGDCYIKDNNREDKELAFYNGTVDGKNCSAVSNFNTTAKKRGVNNKFQMQFRNGTTANGSYSFTIDSDYSKLASSNNYNKSSTEAKDEPTIKYAIYGAKFNAGIQTEEELIHVEVESEPQKVI